MRGPSRGSKFLQSSVDSPPSRPGNQPTAYWYCRALVRPCIRKPAGRVVEVEATGTIGGFFGVADEQAKSAPHRAGIHHSMPPKFVRKEGSPPPRETRLQYGTPRMGISKRYSVVQRPACCSMDLAHWSLGSAARNRSCEATPHIPRWRLPGTFASALLAIGSPLVTRSLTSTR